MRTHHAQQRATERYAIAPDPDDWRGAIMDIIASVEGMPRALLLARQRSGHEHWLVHVRGRDVQVIYDPSQATVVTVLGRGMRAREG